jgi:OOP family OmpA-OmpF porin
MSIELNFRVFKALCLSSLVSVLLLDSAQAAISRAAFNDAYQVVSAVTAEQSQVVYYRLGVPGEKAAAANIYVDNEFHSALLPGGYSVFCVAPGNHGVSAVTDDAPEYAGKHQQPQISFEGGKTVFLRVSENGAEEPQRVSREVAENELLGALRQVHVLSRASAVKSCTYEPQQAAGSYSLSSDVLFGFGKSPYRDLDDKAREAVAELSRRVRLENIGAVHLDVAGYADHFGSESANHTFELHRAEPVRQLWIYNGFDAAEISASSVGSGESISQK